MYKLYWIILYHRRLCFMHAVCSRSLQLHPIRHLVRHLHSMRSRKGNSCRIKFMYKLRARNIRDRGLGFLHAVSCEAGKASSTKGATSESTCTSCEPGSYTTTEASTSCTSCEAGRYSSTVSATSVDTCIVCEAGKAAAAGSSSCTSCIGSYSTTEGSASCTQCAAGRYSSTPSATSSDNCLACEAGKASSTIDSSICTSCEPGTYSTAASESCGDCANGRYATTTASQNICKACEAGKASSTTGTTSCTSCEAGTYTPDEASTSCKSCSEDGVSCNTRACDDDHFNNNGKCEKCDNIVSTMILAGSFLSFAVAAYYSAAIATNRKKMMQLKVATTFFQTAELTTLIKVSWPAIVFFTLPFQLPISDTKCLASSSGWNQLHTFYAYIYGPILIFSVPLLSASGTQPRSSERKKVAGLLTVLISLWYSPLLQTIASMYDCFEDPERENGWFITSDPSVSCEPSLKRKIVNIHAGVLSLVVGLGFPLLSFLKIRSLRKADKLDFDSSLANLFQFYNTRMPYFETVQFVRKGLLILALTWFADSPKIQAISGLGINGSFLLLLSCTRPFAYYPTSNSRRNLFQVAEVSSTITCMIGNTLGLVGSFSASDESFIDPLGNALAFINITFFILFMLTYRREVKESAKREAEWAAGVKINSSLGAELKDAVAEWNLLVMNIEDDDGMEERHRLQIVDEMPFVKSRIVAAMRISLMETEEKHIMNVTHQIREAFNAANFRKKCRRFQRVLDPVNEDFEKFVGEARGPFNVLEIAREQKLEFVSGVLERGDSSTVEEGEGNNPLQEIEMTTKKAKSKADPLSPPPPPPPPPAPPPPPPKSKPDPWISATDATGKRYYIHRETNETVWTKP
ncbi:hypothetical protein TrST_g10996 [Triparma strigata]|uniref:WW domain-containing protein n=1 Tax=Triparma strigata TaxID=1606541 RepID=A0A9W7BFX3_9STRA|nr:hypothetical protein TrST_g10996 [Triparma strigata]